MTDAPTEAHHLREPSLGSNFSWTTLGFVVAAGAQWGILAVMARLGTPEMVGQYALGQTIATPVIVFTNLQLRALQATHGPAGEEFSLYLALRLLACGLALGVITGISLSSNYKSETKFIIVLIGGFKVVEALSDVFLGRLQQLANMKWICLSSILKGGCALTVMTSVLWFSRIRTADRLESACFWPNHELALACLLISVVWLLLFIGVDAPCVMRGSPTRPQAWSALRPSWKLQPLMQLFWLALPLGVVGTLMSLNYNIPRLVLERYHGEHDLGIFSAMASLMQAASLPAAALGMAASSRLGCLYAAGDMFGLLQMLAKLLGLCLIIGFATLLAAYLGGHLALDFFYGAEYSQNRFSFYWLMLAGVGMNLCYILNWAVMAARYIAVQLWFQIALVLVTTVAGFLLIPEGGIKGAALTLLATSFFQVLGTVILLWHAVRYAKPVEVTNGIG